MANFFEGIGNALKHPIDEVKWMWDSTKGVLSGDKKLKDIPGDHQEMMNDITVPILGNNKIAKNSDAVAGAVIGGVLAAPAIAAGAGGGATGASAGAGAGANAATAASAVRPSMFSLGDVSSYFKPVNNMATQFGNTVGNAWDSAMTYGDVSDRQLADLADAEMAGAVDADLGVGTKALRASDSTKLTAKDIAKVMSQVSDSLGKMEPEIRLQKTGGGGRIDKSQYESPLVAREMQALYQQPLYNKLV